MSDIAAPASPAAPNGAAAPVVAPLDPAKLVAELGKRDRLLSDRDKQLKQAQAKFEQDKKAFETQQSGYQTKAQRAEQLEALLANAKDKPDEFLKAGGLDFDTLAQLRLNAGQKTPEMLLEQMNQTWEKQFKSMQDGFDNKWKERDTAEQAAKQQQEQAATEQQKQQMERFSADLRAVVDSTTDGNPESAKRFPLTSKFDASSVAQSAIESHFESTGKLLKLEDAVTKVEEEIEAAVLDVAQSVPGLKTKLQELLKPQYGQVPPTPARRTLSNNLTPTTTPAQQSTQRPGEFRRPTVDDALARWKAQQGK